MNTNAPPVEVILVPHTHWDREWYLPHAEFSLMLVKFIDRLLDILEIEPDFSCFMLDGQTIALEDYLSLKPEASPRIEQYVGQGRIIIGPWYVLPDEVLVSGEAHIRNFLIGRSICQRYGGGMKTGYLPDSFGHPSQIPQILRGLGMDEMIFWRGLGPDITVSEFYWDGFDGTRILGLNMPLSYGVGACLPRDIDEFVDRISKKLADLEPMSGTGVILLMNGVDHVAPERNLPDRIRRANSQQDRFRLVLAPLSEYVDRVRRRIADVDLPVATGELRSGYRAYLLGGTVSTRMYLKQANYHVEYLLEAQLEPLLSVLSILGAGDYPGSMMNALWKQALINLPHDSICGCSVDRVHDQMMERYEHLLQFGRNLLLDSMSILGSATSSPDGDFLMVFNPHPFRASEWIVSDIDIGAVLARRVDHNEARLVEYDLSLGPLAGRIILTDQSGLATAAEILRSEVRETMSFSIDDQPVVRRGHHFTVRFHATDLPALGYRIYRIEGTGEHKSPLEATDDPLELNNEWFRIVPAGDGTVSVTDLESGREYSGLLRLEDGGDCGDEYTYCPPDRDSLVGPDPGSVAVTRSSRYALRIAGLMRLPRRLEESRKRRSESLVECPYSLEVFLHPGVRRIDVRVEIENNVEDHILRIVFPTDLITDRCMAEGTFCIDEQEHIDESSKEYVDWVEKPSNIHPHKGFVTISDGIRGLSVLNRGLPEYQLRSVSGGAALALTLIRCVGSISRDDLQCREGNAGWPLGTPGAQCQGSHVFECAFLPHRGGWREGGVLESSRAYRFPPFAAQLRPPLDPEAAGAPGTVPAEASLLTIDNTDIVLSTVKPAEAGDGFIVRLVNPSSMTCEASVEFGGVLAGRIETVVLCDLKEDASNMAEGLLLDRGVLKLTFRGGEIKTLKLLLSRKNSS